MKPTARSPVSLRNPVTYETVNFDHHSSPERPRQCELLQDIFENPYQAVDIEESWLSWNDSTARKIAQKIYDDQSFFDLHIVADVLEEAGCTDAEILKHCRAGGVHVKGCWVIDLLLEKQ